MPIIKSAKKRVRISTKQGIRNSKTKKSLRTSLKALADAITSSKGVTEAHGEAQSAIDIAVKKGVISKNKAARNKSRINARAKAANSDKTTSSKPATKKAAAKKPVAKKTATKKTTAKKK